MSEWLCERKESVKMKNVNVICIKWGTAYAAEDVNRLYNMVIRNTTKYNVNFICFTDNTEGLLEGVKVMPLPKMNMEPKKLKYAYQKEAGLCDDELGGLTGERVLFFDLDVVIVDKIDCFFEFQEDKEEEFIIINDWNTRGSHVGQASCYSWRVGTLGYIKEYFEMNSEAVIEKFFTASQEYLSSKVIERYGKLNFWPVTWCRSYKQHCLPKFGPARRFVDSKIPEGAKVIAFHGDPKLKDALKGIWSSEKAPSFFKQAIYKTIRPTKWIADYWY